MGRHFVLLSDHAAFQWLRRTPEPMAQMARWLTFMELFDFEVQHRPGARHGNADGLSRSPHIDGEDLQLRRSSGCMQLGSSTEATRSQAACSNGANGSQVELLQEAATQTMDVKGATMDVSASTLSALAPIFVPGLARAAASREQPIGSGAYDSGEASVSAGEKLHTEQLQDPDIGPVMRLRLQQTEAPSVEQLLTESEAAKILWSQ